MKTVVSLLTLTLLLAPGRAADERAPEDTLDGPPLVTAKGWAIADGKTGELLWGYRVNDRFKSASTTKMMCAFVVLSLAEKDSAVLDEIITFSKLADDTSGSTAGVRVGEFLTVGECLYGLLLPSGNDAGNALAEHFHARMDPPDATMLQFGLNNPALKTRVNFIAEMNRTARTLGMTNTIYRSSFGDGGTPADRTTSPLDLLRIAHAAMKNPRFREYVSTRKHSTVASSPDGAQRDVTWKNTNQLLSIKGFDGIKTGTTTQAGSCLVSSGRRGDDHLLMVVLGSESSNGRYVDSRNLYRWAWKQRGHR